MLVDVVLVNLLLELDVLFVNSVDLLSEVLSLSCERLDLLGLLFELLFMLLL